MLALYTFFTLINIAAIIRVYIPYIRPKFYAAIALHNVLNDWILVARLYLALIAIAFKQWLNNTCIRVAPNKYLLRHVIGGKVVKLLIKKVEPEVICVTKLVDDDVEPLNDAMPYLRYEQVAISASDLGCEAGSVGISTLKSYKVL